MSWRPNLGRWSLGLALTSVALLLVVVVIGKWILTGSPTLVPSRPITGPGRLAGYEPIGRLALGAIVACAGAALSIGILGIRRERSMKAWIGAFIGLSMLVPNLAAFAGLGLLRLGIRQEYVTALAIAAPNLVLILALLAVGRFIWRATRTGPPHV